MTDSTNVSVAMYKMFLKFFFYKCRFCIPNGVPDTYSKRQERLDRDAHPLDYITDGDSSTTWVSSDDLYMPGGLTMTIDLENGEYQVCRYLYCMRFNCSLEIAATFWAIIMHFLSSGYVEDERNLSFTVVKF